MANIQLVTVFIKKPKFILALILVVFFLKGVFIAAVFPIFTGQDEARHYNTVQFLAEPEEKTWPISERGKFDSPSFDQYNFSSEIRNTGMAANFDIARHLSFGTVPFADGYDGQNEALINSKPWQPINDLYPPDMVGGITNLFHTLESYIERLFASSSILVRFFLERIFSVTLGTLAILLTYLIAKNIGLREKESLIITAIIAFQPKFSMYTTNINYDALFIPLFFLFTLGAILSLKDGPNWKNMAIMFFSTVLALFTKGTGLILLAVFIFMAAFLFHQKLRGRKNMAKYYAGAVLALVVFMFLISRITGYDFLGLIIFKGGLGGTLTSLSDYLNKSLTLGRFGLSSRTYWGALDWGDNVLIDNFTNVVWLIQTIAAIGLAIFLFSRKKIDYLPEKKYIIFLIGMIVALQLGIRFADWRVFSGADRLELGTPGRYFLPNLATHLILVFLGLGALLKKEKYFNITLLAGLLAMFAFSMYIIIDVVIPRTYL